MQCHPWDGDKDLHKIFLAKGMRRKNLLNLSQCRISHQVMYLSCISTAKGKHLDKTFLAPPQDKEWLSEVRFAREEPMPQDWKLWESFWCKYCNRHFELPSPMGRWEYPGHRVWPWLLDEEQNVVYRQSYQSILLNLCLTLKLMIRLIPNYETVDSSNG